MKTIILDAGHGGPDPGTHHQGVLEKDVALDFALTLKFVLVNAGYQVVMTRSGDSYPALSMRTKLEGDAFVSLHFNSPNAGTLIYFSPHNGSRDLAEAVDRYFKSGRLWESSRSNHGRLYIDDFKGGPAILIELDSIDKVRNHRDERLIVSGEILNGLNEYFGC